MYEGIASEIMMPHFETRRVRDWGWRGLDGLDVCMCVLLSCVRLYISVSDSLAEE
jgi:hypothetical protein